MKLSIFCANFSTGTSGTLTAKVESIVAQASWVELQEEIKFVRTQVFIIEQCVPENLEWDGLDDTAIHVLATSMDNKPVGTARLLASGQIGRMAVLKHLRGRGIGTALLKKLIQLATDNAVHPLFLNAQIHAIGFYERHGFIPASDVFDDAGIPHRKMIPGSQ